EGEADERPAEPLARPAEMTGYQHRVRSETLARAGRTAEAVDEARQAVALMPDYPATLLHLAKLLRAQDAGEEAAGLEREAQQLRDADPLYHAQIGRSAQHTGAIEEA